MIKVTTSGDYSKTRNALEKMLRGDIFADLDKYGQIGVEALMAATPVDTGLTSHSWSYRVIKTHNRIGIEWLNINEAGNTGVPVAILIQHGHGTGTGGWVQGRDFINPALRPVFDALVDEIWKEVNK